MMLREAPMKTPGRPSTADLLRYFLYLGSLGFGGPVALVGYMQRDLVERRGGPPRTSTRSPSPCRSSPLARWRPNSRSASDTFTRRCVARPWSRWPSCCHRS